MKEKNLKVVGTSVDRVDGMALACGTAEFADDIDIKGVLVGKILWSSHAHARIKSIDASEAEEIPGVHSVLTHENVPRVPHTTAGQGFPEPSPYDTVVLDNKVRFVGDRVAAVAAETEELAEEALRKIKVEYEILPAVFDPLEAEKEGASVIHDEPDSKNIPDPEHNIAAKYEFSVNQTEWFSEADVVIEKEYRTQHAQHCAMEPHITIARLDEQGRLVIRTSTQVPFHVRRIVAQALNIPVRMIRVIKPRIGGGFGSKQEILLEDICAALVLASKRPVKMEFTRKETFISSRTRHPSIVRLKTGVKKDGTITDAQMEIILNTGAYGSHALTVMMCSGSHTLPMYKAGNVAFSGRSVYTNLPVSGAYRGYGATQGFFAWESQMDQMAEAIGMDPMEFRKKNYIKVGETSPVFKAMGEGREGVEQYITSCGMSEAIDQGFKASDWDRKREEFKTSEGHIRRGMGCACMMQGSGIPEIDMASATVKINDDGSFNLIIGATDLGTGADTVLAQMAAEVLGVRTTDIVVRAGDTDVVPFDTGAYASSTTYISGYAVKKAAEKTKAQILEVASGMLNESKENLRLEEGDVISSSGKCVSLSEVAKTSFYCRNQFQIMGSASHVAQSSPPPFAAHFAEVEVDVETGQVKVVDYVAAVDCGTAVNPALAEGQVEGSVLNGISYALCEEMIFSHKGVMLNPSFGKYKIFNSEDAPHIRTILVPTYEPTGPFGAKSVSEVCINGPQPAIANAICDAVGVRLLDAPFTPDKVLSALKKKGSKIKT